MIAQARPPSENRKNVPPTSAGPGSRPQQEGLKARPRNVRNHVGRVGRGDEINPDPIKIYANYWPCPALPCADFALMLLGGRIETNTISNFSSVIPRWYFKAHKNQREGGKMSPQI